MPHRLLPPFLLLLAACGPRGEGSVADDGPTSETGTPTVPTDTDVTDPEPVAFTAVTDRLDERYGTLVWVSWTQSTDASVHLEYEVDPGEWRSSPARDLAAGTHEEVLLGVPYDTPVSWRVVGDNAAGTTSTDDRTSRTAARPPTLPAILVRVDAPADQDPEMPYVLTSTTEPGGNIGDPWWIQVVDRRGRVVWGALTSPERITMHVRLSVDGRSILVDQNSYWGRFDQGATSAVTRMTLDGALLETWDTPGLHHDYVELPDGSLLYGAYQGFYSNELLMEITPDRRAQVLFDCEAWLGSEGFGSPLCGSNTITWNAPTNRLYWSLFSLDTILELDRDTGEVVRWFGDLPGSYAFDPPDSQFWYQHGGYVTTDGTLLLSTHVSERGHETVVREYAIDDATDTLTEVWNFGVGDGVWGEQMGEAHRLPGGNVLHNYGTLARLREGLHDGTVVWDVEWDDAQIGRSIPVSDLYALVGERP